MSGHVITYAPDADPSVVAKIEAARAKLKPCCTRCRRILLKREIRGTRASERTCADKRACITRAITRAPAPALRPYVRRYR